MMKKYINLVSTCLFIISFILLVTNSSAQNIQNDNSPSNQKRLWNLKSVNIITLINEVARETKHNFVVAPQVDGKVTFISSYPLSSEELYQAFLALLQTSGFEAIQEGNIVKIIPNTFAKESVTRLFENNKKNEMAVMVARVKYVPAAELVTALRQLVFHLGYIEVYPPTNDIIISDHYNNITHILSLIHKLDKPTASAVEVIHLNYAAASELVHVISSLLQAKSSAGNNVVLGADDRSNDILLRGGTPEQRLQIRSLIHKLDVRLTKKKLETDVIYLKYLRAEKVAVIIKGIIENYLKEKNSSSITTSTSESGSVKQPEQGQSYQANFSNLANQASTFSSNTDQNLNSSGGEKGTNLSKVAQRQSNSGSVSPYVQWEESTNSLIVSAPTDLMTKLKTILAKLDIRRPQVLIEAVIAEVQVSRAAELGIEINTGGKLQLLTRFASTLPVSGIGNNNMLAISNPATPNATGQGLSALYSVGNNIRFLIRALEQDTRSNILSTPNIVTLDNEPAQIKVGKRISFSIGQIQNNPTGGNPFNFFNQQDVGLILTINPQITPDGSIKLIIEQELSNVLPGQVSAGNNPDLSERFIHTTVMANNGDILVLGGLIQDEWQETTSKVPLLGDIPTLGILFRNRERQLVKQNLMIFLRPTILYEDKESIQIIGGKYEYLRQQQLETEKRISIQNEMTSPVLPPLEKNPLPPPFMRPLIKLHIIHKVCK